MGQRIGWWVDVIDEWAGGVVDPDARFFTPKAGAQGESPVAPQ